MWREIKLYIQTLKPKTYFLRYLDNDEEYIVVYVIHRSKIIWSRHFKVAEVMQDRGVPNDNYDNKFAHVIRD